VLNISIFKLAANGALRLSTRQLRICAIECLVALGEVGSSTALVKR